MERAITGEQETRIEMERLTSCFYESSGGLGAAAPKDMGVRGREPPTDRLPMQ